MHHLPVRFWVGLCGLGLIEILLVARQPLVGSFFTPLAWTCYILVVDGLLERLRGDSPLRRRPAHVGWVAVASIGIWYVFEGYNLRMEGWRYVGLPESYVVRILGYFWAFATIGPGMLLTRELVAATILRSRRDDRPETIARRALPRALAIASVIVGLACLVSPFLVPQSVSRYLWAPVWAGVIFALDPINAALGRASIWRDALDGRNARLWSLLLAGLVCGVLWEFWNFWALTKWHYTFPFPGIEHLKAFEMPIVGFVGFPPFAVEYFVATELIAVLWRGSADLASDPPSGVPSSPTPI